MRTTDVGNLSTLKCMQAFLEAGYLVSLPFGDGSPYDLIVDDGEKLHRVECKTARFHPKVYVIAPEHLSHTMIRLRVSPAANNQAKGVRWARDFEIVPLTR